MLKSALGDRMKETTGSEENIGNEEVGSGNDETLSQHSDGIVEYGPKKPRPGKACMHFIKICLNFILVFCLEHILLFLHFPDFVLVSEQYVKQPLSQSWRSSLAQEDS